MTGETVTYHYLANNQISVVSSNGGTVTLDRGADGQFGTSDDRVVSSSLDLAKLAGQFMIPESVWGEDGVVTVGSIRHFYQGGRLVSSTDTQTGETVSYTYHSDGTQVTIRLSSGISAVVALGSEGALGRVAVQASTAAYQIERDASGRIVRIVDYEKGVETVYQYESDGTARIVTREVLSGRLLAETHLRVGQDNVVGGTDDVYLSVTGFKNGNLFSETFDAQGRLISSDAYEKILSRDAAGRLLRFDGSLAMTEAEAAYVFERRLALYHYDDVCYRDWETPRLS